MPGRTRAATIIDVAALAGVSRQTVTRAMNDQAGISAGTRDRVLAAARELHYRPSRFGRGMVKPGRPTVGLLVLGLTNPFYPELASSVVDEAVAHGWNVTLVDIRHARSGAIRLRDLADQVDAIIGYVDPGALGSEQLPGTLPVVALNEAGPASGRAWIGFDVADGMAQMAHHLLAVGCERPAMIDVGPRPTSSPRAKAFVDEMARLGRDVVLESTSSADTDASAAAVRRLLDRTPEIDALLAFNDFHALAIMRELRALGRDVPGSVAVAGIDGLAMSALAMPSLTSLALDTVAVARHAMELTVGMYSGRLPMSGDGLHRTLPFRLRLGESTRRG